MSGTLVLDCEGLSKLVRRDPELTEWLRAADAEDIRVVTSSVTLVVPPDEAVARQTSELLATAGLHGHKYALDAIVAATALASPRPTTVLTSDPEDLRMLCSREITVVKV